MFETVTVDEALKKGRKTVTIPVLLIMGASFILTAGLYGQFQPPIGMLFLGIVLSFLLPWLYWSFMITRWRIWAFENVRNVHELKKRAIKEQLIWKDGNFFEKTEIRSNADKEILAALQRKFDIPDVFSDDFSVPAETVILYSKNKSLIEVILGLAMAAGSVYFFLETDKPMLGGALIVIGLVISFLGIKKYSSKTPQIVISNKGIQTEKIPFYAWSEIANEEVIAVQTGKTRHYYFVYNNPSGVKRQDIASLDTDRRKLESLLRVYRGRSEKSLTNH